MASSDPDRPVRKGLPHGIPAWVRDGEIWFITVCVADRGQSVLSKQDSALTILNAAKFYHEADRWYSHLFLLMPDHAHALISFPRGESMTKLVGQWKAYTARKTAIRWQRDYFDHRLRSDESYGEKAAYIRNNPVRAGLVATADDWPWIFEPPRGEQNFPKAGVKR